jgi:tyrosine-protein phosphatase YwqE
VIYNENYVDETMEEEHSEQERAKEASTIDVPLSNSSTVLMEKKIKDKRPEAQQREMFLLPRMKL